MPWLGLSSVLRERGGGTFKVQCEIYVQVTWLMSIASRSYMANEACMKKSIKGAGAYLFPDTGTPPPNKDW